MPGLEVRSIAQMKCIYANAQSMGNKQEELEASMQQVESHHHRNMVG